jgi:hypothetical protein
MAIKMGKVPLSNPQEQDRETIPFEERLFLDEKGKSR